jgi:hypothetical protein
MQICSRKRKKLDERVWPNPCVALARRTRSWAIAAQANTMPFVFESTLRAPTGARYFGGNYQGGIALSADTLAVGSWGTNSNSGRAYVYRYDEASLEWGLEAALEPDDPAGDFFGISVALSESGRLAVGAPNDQAACTGTQYCGAVYLYERRVGSSGPAWELAHRLVDHPAPQAGSAFGWFVALRGSTLVVGSPYHTGGGRMQVYSLSEDAGAAVERIGSLYARDASPGSNFGWACAISADEQRIIVGASRTGGVRGAAYVFEHADAQWSQLAKLSDDEGEPGDRLGTSVGLIERGSTATLFAAGSKHKSIGGAHHNGGAFLYAGTPPGTSERLLKPPAGDGALNGGVIAARGTTLLVGPYGAGCNPMPGETCADDPDQGKVYVYHSCSSIRSCPLDSVLVPDGTDDAVADRFGASIALGEGGRLAIAAPTASSGAGMVYMYAWTPPSPPLPVEGVVLAAIAAVVAAAMVGLTFFRRAKRTNMSSMTVPHPEAQAGDASAATYNV